MFVYKISDIFFIKQNDKPIEEEWSFNIKIIYTKTSYGQKYINYLCPVNFSSLPIDSKRNIFLNNINIKKFISNVLFNKIIQCLCL
jgi:hypothetical protein